MDKETINQVRELAVASFLSECDRLGLSNKTIGDLVFASRQSVALWRTGKFPFDFLTVMAIIDVTPKLASLSESQAVSIRRKTNGAELIRNI